MITCDMITIIPDLKPGSIIMSYTPECNNFSLGHVRYGPWLVIGRTASGGYMVISIEINNDSAQPKHCVDILLGDYGSSYIDTFSIVHLECRHNVVIGAVSDEDLVSIRSLCRKHLSFEF